MTQMTREQKQAAEAARRMRLATRAIEYALAATGELRDAANGPANQHGPHALTSDKLTELADRMQHLANQIAWEMRTPAEKKAEVAATDAGYDRLAGPDGRRYMIPRNEPSFEEAYFAACDGPAPRRRK